MPTKEDMDRVTSEIDLFISGLDVVPIEEKHAIPASDGRKVLFWDDLVGDHRRDALATAIDWNGFTEAQKDDVIRRVLDGESNEFWMAAVVIDQFVTEKDLDGYLSWLTGDPEKTRERLKQVEAYDINQAEALDNRPLRPLTQQLVDCVLMDIWPGNAAIIDFGIDSNSHLGALQYAIKFGQVTPQELDAAMGSGAKLTEIAQRGENPYRDVVFKTSWDKMFVEPPDEPSGQDNETLLTETASDQSATTVQILFEQILHGRPEPQPEHGHKEKEVDHER